jgi:hypothetical protein
MRQPQTADFGLIFQEITERNYQFATFGTLRDNARHGRQTIYAKPAHHGANRCKFGFVYPNIPRSNLIKTQTNDPAILCYAERTSSRRARARDAMSWLRPNPAGRRDSTSALATWPCAHRSLFACGAPAIDHIEAEAPFRADPKPGQLFRAQQSIHGGWMYPQIFGQFPHGKHRGRGRCRARFFGSSFFHEHTLINIYVQRPAPRHSKDA